MKKSKFARNASPVIVSDEMTGKMEGFPSISTTCKCNSFCQHRMQNEKLICHHCFADGTTSAYKDLERNCEKNFELLTTRVLDWNELPLFNTRENAPRVKVNFVEQCRIESFGDTFNETQCINYMNIARKNPSVIFGYWTKNYGIIQAVCEKYGKPDNVILIASSPILNLPLGKLPKWFDKIFTVYTKEYIKEHNIVINCGARACKTCRACYTHNDTAYMNEELK